MVFENRVLIPKFALCNVRKLLVHGSKLVYTALKILVNFQQRESFYQILVEKLEVICRSLAFC